MLQGSEAEGADTLFEGKGTKNNRDFQISRKIFQSGLEKFLSCYSSSAPNSLAISSDFLICSIKVWRHMLSSRKSASSFLMSSSGLVAMAVRSKSMLSISLRRRFRVPIYQKTTLSDRTLQLKGLLPEEPLLYATMSIGSQVATHFVLLVFFEQIASFFLYF